MTNSTRRIASSVVLSVSLGVSLSACSIFGGTDTLPTVESTTAPSPSSTVTQVPLWNDATIETPSLDDAPSTAPTAPSTSDAPSPVTEPAAAEDDAAAVKTTIDAFFAAIKADAESAVTAGNGKLEPKLSTFDQEFKKSYTFIDRNQMNMQQSSSLLYGIAMNFVESPEMTITASPSGIEVNGTSAIVHASGLTMSFTDGSKATAPSDSTEKIGLSKVGDTWLVTSDTD